MTRVFLIEDDLAQAEVIKRGLGEYGFEVEHFAEPHQFIYCMAKFKPGVILLDWRLPELSGPQVLTVLREKFDPTIPVIMLTSLSDEAYMVEALLQGADDFIVKPCGPAGLSAKINALLRRSRVRGVCAQKRITIEPYTLDLAAQSVELSGLSVSLTPREFELAWKLFSCVGRFVSKEEIWCSIWGKGVEVDQHTLVQHVYNLRRKLKLDTNGFKLASVYGAGYRLHNLAAEREDVQTDNGGKDGVIAIRGSRDCERPQRSVARST